MNFIIRQRRENLFTFPFRECAIILTNEQDQILRQLVRHIDHFHYPGHSLIVPTEITDLSGQIMLDRALNTGTEKFRRIRAIEISVQVGGIVQHSDIVFGGGTPFDEIHQGHGMCLERPAVIIDPIQHDGRHREDHAWRGVLTLGQDVMNQTAVHAAVAILKWVDINKAKGSCRRLQNGFQFIISHAVIGGQHAGTQGFEVFGPGADEFRQGITEMA